MKKIILSLSLLATILLISGYSYSKKEKEYMKQLEKQKDIVMNYLNSKYPEYDFEIIEVEEGCMPYTPFDCEDIYINKVLLKSHNKEFYINVYKYDLSIEDDEFEYIYEEIKENEKES